MTTKLSAEFEDRTETIRGTTYIFRELSANEYEEIVKLVQDPEGNAELNKVMRLMTVKSLTSPKVDDETLGRKPYPVYRELLRVVSDIHFGDMPKSTPAAESGETPPNG